MRRGFPPRDRESVPPVSRSRWWAVLRPFLIMVGIPTVMTGFYYGLVASDVFVSETRYAIRTGEQAPATGLLASMLGPAATTRAGDDASIVRDYILARDMLDELDRRLDLRRSLHRAHGGHPLPAVAGCDGRGVPRVLPRQGRGGGGDGDRHYGAQGAGLRRRDGAAGLRARSSS